MRTFLSFLSLLALAGCAAQTDTEYTGEPLATIQGSVVTQAAAAPTVDAAIMWGTIVGHGFDVKLQFVGSRVHVAGSFPASFKLELFAPPRADGQMTEDIFDERPTPTGTWIGMVAAVRSTAEDPTADDVVGIDPGHYVIYLDHDVVPTATDDSTSSDYAAHLASNGGPTTKGYHLLKYVPPPAEEVTRFQKCIYGSVCIRFTRDADAREQAGLDRVYDRCRELLPEAPTCTIVMDHSSLSPEELAENDRCVALQKNDHPEACPSPYRLTPNPDGFADPVTIELGTKLPGP